MMRYKVKDLRKLFIGVDKKIFLKGKGLISEINFDNAATTPAFKQVMKSILTTSPYYGSIARGCGLKSQYSTELFEECRNYILDFFNAPSSKYTAIFVNNTTEGLNRLSNILINNKNDIVICTRMEHHSNDIPWRDKCNLKYVEVDGLGRLKLDNLEYLLDKYKDQVKYVTVTGASNVTGYINDLKTIAKYTHKYGAKLIVDGAQLVPHKNVSILGNEENENIDFLVFSGHKIYAPFGSGVIIGLKDYIEKNDPDYIGGGTVDLVLDNRVIYLDTPYRNEPGSQNFFGALAVMESLKQYKKIGYQTIEDNENTLKKLIIDGMHSIDKVILYGDNDNLDDRLGITTFNISDIPSNEVCTQLTDLNGIATRAGSLCAQPYIRRIFGIGDKELINYINQYGRPSLVRVSFGMYNTPQEVNTFLETLEYISKNYKPTSLE